MPAATVPAHAHEWTFPHETHVAAVGDCTACHDPALATPRAQLDGGVPDCQRRVELGCRAVTRLDENVAPGPAAR
jgi:predicted CXXCH cytochrome family protein